MGAGESGNFFFFWLLTSFLRLVEKIARHHSHLAVLEIGWLFPGRGWRQTGLEATAQRWWPSSHPGGTLSSVPSPRHGARLSLLCCSLPRLPGPRIKLIQISDHPRPQDFPFWYRFQPSLIVAITISCVISGYLPKYFFIKLVIFN